MNEVTFKQRVISIFKDNMYDRNIGNKRSGKLDTKGLRRIVTTDRVFKKKEERKNKKYAISLLIDCSGSMEGQGKIGGAALAACKLASAFSSISSIDLEIVGFNAIEIPFKKYGESVCSFPYLVDWITTTACRPVEHFDAYKGYSCNEDSRLAGHRVTNFEYIRSAFCAASRGGLQTFTKKNLLQKDFISLFSHDPSPYYLKVSAGDNNDGRAVYNATSRITKKDGKKIIIVLSDGEPAPSEMSLDGKPYKEEWNDLELQVKKSIKSGVNFIGVGVFSSAVKDYYPEENTVVISKISDLYPAIIEKLNEFVKRG